MKIIAEIGSNWKTLEDIIHSIKQAKTYGADAIKLQLFVPCEMTGVSSAFDYKTPYLDPDWISEIAGHCVNDEIEFMCTAFSSGGYHAVNDYVKSHKIASAEITDMDILKTVNSFGKPVCLSTGGATLDQIEFALTFLKGCPVTIMYCVTDYPARIVDFRNIEELRETFGSRYSYGYSDHSIDVLNIPLLAQKHGCSVIEKHVNFTEHIDTDDAPHSLNGREFGLMARRLRGEEISLSETLRPCGWQRKFMTLPNGNKGYFRPSP